MTATCFALGVVLRAQVVHLQRRWYLYLPVFGVWAAAYLRLFIDPAPHVPLLFNWTGSLPYHVAWYGPAPQALRRGDYVIFSFDGEAKQSYPGLRHQPFFKIVRGLPGDRVSVSDHVVRVNGEVVGIAKPFTFDRRPLEPIRDGVIPAGHYYVQGTSADSFDSRYRLSGLIRADQVLGTATPLF